MLSRSVGLVDKKFISFGKSIENALDLESGKKLSPVTLAYEVYGKLNKRKDNAILIFHSLTMDSHAAGQFPEGNDQIGWWDEMIGPGKAFDTNLYFIICSNVIGGCGGSTGPSSIDPETGKPYGNNFPIITLSDMVKAQKRLTDHLCIKKLLCVAGGSMGGMLALQWFANYPETTKSVIPIATAWKQSPQQIAFSEVGRQAIMRDPNWN
ncbi:MAG: alpha/beta fold hydrolase, partial [Candidatus Aminicenantes bacterium]|nr:alpha/beta fold hydrolase [Candidatus Aminicenantes bacterium]